ncbi:MAG: hypothetical protein Q9M15_09240 [Mariprofundaceae bacterium]|nr:hypothetical protein [Mariprofundaceae bacterium]
MSLGIRPTDALVHRLLQQNTRSATETSRDSGAKQSHVEDQVNISSEARKGSASKQSGQTYTPSGQSAAYKQEDLEARLLKMYSHSQET